MTWLDLVEKLWPIALVLGQIATAAGALWLRSQFAPRRVVEEIRARQREHEARLDAALAALPPPGDWSAHRDRVTDARHQVELLAQRLGSMPDVGQILQIRDGVADLRTSHAALKAEVDGLKFSVDRAAGGVARIEQFLLERKA